MKRFKCCRCDSIFDEDELREDDHGGYEEFWGAKVWHHQYVNVSPCCGDDDYEEVTDEDE